VTARSEGAGPPLAEGRIANVSAALLVGGASRRMGRDKAGLPWRGTVLATHLARLLTEQFEDVMLVGGSPPADAPGRRVPDAEGPPCALRGLVAALEAARAPRVLVVATDLPLLGSELLLTLLAWPEADVVLPRTARGLEPLCALWDRDAALPVARRQLEAGRLALHELVSALGPGFLEGPDLRAVDRDGAMLTNVNTPEEWAELEARARDPG
jgi:molybdopterin-guanine dinucleotide biosynthesis protein A